MSAIKILSGLDISGTTSDVVINSNVGINTQNPLERLHVVGNACITGNLFVDGSIPATSCYCDTFTSVLGNTAFHSIGKSFSDDYLEIIPAYFSTVLGGDMGIRFYSTDGNAACPTMTIEGCTGNVGIGTSSPETPLHIFNSTSEMLRLETSTATESPFISFYQEDTRRGFIQWNDTEDSLKLSNEYGSLKLLTGTGGNEQERLIIDSAGNVGIGTCSPSAKLDVNGDVCIREDNCISFNDGRLHIFNDGRSEFISEDYLRICVNDHITLFMSATYTNLYYDSNVKFRTRTNGVCIFGCGFATDFIASSDCRLKENFTSIEDPIELTMGLCGQKFNWKKNNKEVEYGLIAQEVAQVAPELVSCQKLDLTPERDEKEIDYYNSLGITDYIMGVKYEKVIPILIEAIKKQQQEIKEIKDKLYLLESKVK